MDAFIRLLAGNPLLLLFVVAGIGFPLGQIKVKGVSLGLAAILFVGLLIGSFDERLKLPEIVYQIGLVIFIYNIGLATGPAFFSAIRRKGLLQAVVGVVVLVGVALVVAKWAQSMGLNAALASGLFCGSMTTTPGLAAVLELSKGTAHGSDPIVGYSIAYPMAVLGCLSAMLVFIRFVRAGADDDGQNNRIVVQTLTLGEATAGRTIAELREIVGPRVIFTRIRHGEQVALASPSDRVEPGDDLTIVGEEKLVDRAAARMGATSGPHLELDQTEFRMRRIFVSSAQVAGRSLAEIGLPQSHQGLVTRVRRGDTDFVPSGETVLEYGDRARVVARPDELAQIARLFGDSYRALSEIDVFSFSIGIAIGLLIGEIPIPVPGGFVVKLGLSGGPLLVALILGTIHRTGRFVWTLPYSANLTLRQLGLILFVAGVGTRAGYAFWQTLSSGRALPLFLFSFALTTSMAVIYLAIGHLIFRTPKSTLLGMVSGLQTQPAALGLALEQTGSEKPNVGYTMIFPFAILTKIIAAQMLYQALR